MLCLGDQLRRESKDQEALLVLDTRERDHLTDDERRVLLDLVHCEIENSGLSLSGRVRMLKHIRLKLRRATAKARREEEDKPRRRR
jgi:hypothetical protein